MKKEILENDETSDRAKILVMLTYSTLSLVEQTEGEIFDCSMRVTVVIIKEQDKWLIHHTHYS